MLTKLFWTFAGVDLVLLLILLVVHLTQGGRGSSSGGREMELFYFIVVPAIVLGLTVLLFQFSNSTFLKIVAILLSTIPWVFLIGYQARNLYFNYYFRQEAIGKSTFTDPSQLKLAKAIVGNSPDIESIVRSGVPLNQPGSGGVTFLHFIFNYAAVPNRENCVRVGRILLAAGADPNLADSEGKTPAFYADKQTRDLLAAFLDKGIDPNRKDNDGKPLLLYMHQPECAQLLIAKGADLNATDAAGNTALMQFGILEQWQTVLLLLEHRADWRIAPAGSRSLAELAGTGEGLEPTSARSRVVEWLKKHREKP